MSSLSRQKATFAAGCFWGVESVFKKIPGVISTKVGYTGGHTTHPIYSEVCTDKTGHAEAIEIIFDPNQISYAELLNVFWENHNPTTLNRQGPDVGTQYRSAIFYHDDEQARIAQESKQALEKTAKFTKPIVTEITPAAEFYPAEEYHQNYCEKNHINHCTLQSSDGNSSKK